MDDVVWEAPGPGSWSNDRVHFDRPACGFARRAGWTAAWDAMYAGFQRSGIAIEHPVTEYVNAWPYSQRRPVTDPAQWQVLERNAREMLEGKLWRELAAEWHGTHRPAIHAACAELQDCDPASLTDSELAEQLPAAGELLGNAQTHHFLQIGLVSVIGELVLLCGQAGFPPSKAVALLEGASPATARAREHLTRIAAALSKAGVKPSSLEEVRGASPDAEAALDDYLSLYGWRVVAGFDFDRKALIEMPDVILTSIRAAATPAAISNRAEATATEIRSALEVADRTAFDELLADARLVYGLRDDDVGPVMWARGLVRRGILEAGGRLVERGHLLETDDAFEVGPEELIGLLLTGQGPSAVEVAERSALRRRQALLTPPPLLGDPPAPQPTGLPPLVARVTSAFGAYIGQARPTTGERLRGQGIGSTPYRGRARVVALAEDAIAELEPGDVLVTTMTTPAFNGVMTIAGAVVVQEGGLMTHAAIMARELGLPAVVGVTGLLEDVNDGDVIEVDPSAGAIRIVERAT